MKEMQSTEHADIQRGIWIDEKWLLKVELGTRFTIEARRGEICIRSASGESVSEQISEKGWKLFGALGDDADEGCLENASENHDAYLYGKKS